MSGSRVKVTGRPHQCEIHSGDSPYWPRDENGKSQYAYEGSVWRCGDCGAYYRVQGQWTRHYPGPFKRRRYRKQGMDSQ